MPGIKESDGNAVLIGDLLAAADGDLRRVQFEAALGLLAQVRAEASDVRLADQLRYLQHHPSAHLRSKIALLMGQANPDVNHVRRLLATSDGRLRANAIESLWGSADAAAVTLFNEAKLDPVSRVAINALVGLCKAGDRQAYASLVRLGEAGEAPIRAGAKWALAELAKTPALAAALSLCAPAAEVASPEAAFATPAGRWFEQPQSAAALTDSAVSVLEGMCFVAAEPLEAPAPITSPYLTAEVEFRGQWTGRCLAELPESCARLVAANFAGVPDPDSLEIRQVIELLCEFVNMLCGGTIGRLDCPGITTLAPPHLLWDWPGSFPGNSVERYLQVDDGDVLRLAFAAAPVL